MKAKASHYPPNHASAHSAETEPQVALLPFIQRILVPIDFSDSSLRAMDFGLKLALDVQARVTLLHVIEGTAYSIEPGAEENYQHLVSAERERLVDLVKKRSLTAQRSHTEVLVRIGRASSEIPDTAKALGADLIVMGAQGQSPLQNTPLGSTADRVLRHAACAVLTVR